ncbi:hypothetical protein BM613_07010 [Sulfoacidibacillus thermotolerans]|uniref:SAM-dependent methyltransferase n=2 Tax=Sulfoacidibacillus thermotolerans TaxID=1765684 RepID=A0A2U3D8X9_SULT2|nr:hypothetical protein BM613_07010 [Sulfoacidibacillus thermotolerans]
MSAYPIPFSTYMKEALYGENGYYMTERDRFGRLGDFYTSAQVSPLFGALWARFVMEQSPLTHAICIVELGCGDGDLAAGLVKEWLRVCKETQRLLYVGIDLSPFARKRTVERLQQILTERDCNGVVEFAIASTVEAAKAMQKDWPQTTWVIGNEVLDALPCEVVRVTRNKEVWRLMVTTAKSLPPDQPVGPFGGKQLVTYFEPVVAGPLQEYANRYVFPLFAELDADVLITEMQVSLPQLIREITEVLHPRYIAWIDYGGLTRDVIAEDRPYGSLRSYFAHHMIEDWLDLAGEVDVTFDVDFTFVSDVLFSYGYTTQLLQRQGPFLMGISALEEVFYAMQQKDHSLSQKLKQLVMPGGFGDRFFVMLAEPLQRG